MDQKKNSKDEVYWNILNCAVDLELKKGHLKWTLSELSRKSQVTRSLVYYYFGRSKIAIVEEAINIIGKELIGLSEKRLEMWRQQNLRESLLETRKIYENAPNLCVFYLINRGRANSVGKSLDRLEKSFYKKMKDFKPTIEPEISNTLFALYFGIAFSPNVGVKEVDCFVELISDLVV